MKNEEQKIWHELDKEYFNEYSAPVMENMQRLHYTNINSTITFYGPMLYYLVRALGCEHVLELGTAEGYTSFYLASAVKDNAVRYKMEGNMYYGVDVRNMKVHEHLTDRGLPNKFLYMDTNEITTETFKDITFDLIFQDGPHDTEHVLHEFETLWPQLKGEGKGYWIFHDCYGPAEEGFRILKRRFEKKEVDAEWIRLDSVYGIAIIRKMDGYDESKRHWQD